MHSSAAILLLHNRYIAITQNVKTQLGELTRVRRFELRDTVLGEADVELLYQRLRPCKWTNGTASLLRARGMHYGVWNCVTQRGLLFQKEIMHNTT